MTELHQYSDGRMMLKQGEHIMWINTPNAKMVFRGENVDDIIDDHADWLKRNVGRLNWLNDSTEGIVITL